ncbi:MAG TPA: cytochrome c, partial [Casimicrobiaceae bacterium]|nr:cytochrome c [Casimicrobiaceae bacterium]
MKHTRPWKIILVLIGAFAIAMTWTMGRHASSAGAASPPPGTDASYDQTLVAKGAWLAAIGNCNTCHTASNGRTFAGGRPL